MSPEVEALLTYTHTDNHPCSHTHIQGLQKKAFSPTSFLLRYTRTYTRRQQRIPALDEPRGRGPATPSERFPTHHHLQVLFTFIRIVVLTAGAHSRQDVAV